jgi:hypothetical protein
MFATPGPDGPFDRGRKQANTPDPDSENRENHVKFPIEARADEGLLMAAAWAEGADASSGHMHMQADGFQIASRICVTNMK